jgi:hypothetical protein
MFYIQLLLLPACGYRIMFISLKINRKIAGELATRKSNLSIACKYNKNNPPNKILTIIIGFLMFFIQQIG